MLESNTKPIMKNFTPFALVFCLQFFFCMALAQNQFLNFDGSDDYVQIGSNASIDYSGDFTLEVRFKRERLGVREDLVTKKDLDALDPSTNDVAITINPNDKIEMFFRETVSNESVLTSITSIDTASWFHVAGFFWVSN